MSRHSPSPPALAGWLLACVFPADYNDAMTGDLMEEYAVRIEASSRVAASWWLWSQVCRSVPCLAIASLRNARWPASAAVAFGVFVVMAMLEVAADSTITRVAAPVDATRVAIAPMLFLAATSAAGWIAARIHRGSTLFLAVFVLLTVIILIANSPCPIPVPWWYRLAFLTLGPVSVILAPTIPQI